MSNEELIKAFKNHLDYYKDLKDKWEFLKTPEDRAFHAGKTQGMLLGLEVIERISIPQPEQFKVEIVEHPIVGARTILYEIKSVGNQNINFLDKFYLKQEALDFCKRFNLKVVNESDKDGLK